MLSIKYRDRAITEIEQALAEGNIPLYEELKKKYGFQELGDNEKGKGNKKN